MMKYYKRIPALFMAALVLAGSLTACAEEGEEIVVFTTPIPENVVFTVEDTECTKAQLKLLMLSNRDTYGDIYGIDVSEAAAMRTEAELSSYIRDLTLSQCARLCVMNEIASDYGIELSDIDRSVASSAAVELVTKLSEETIDYLDITIDEISKLYELLAVSDKVYEHITEGISTEVSDDEARVVRVRQIFVEDEDKAGKVGEELAAGADFAVTAASYNEADEITLEAYRGDFTEDIEKVIFALDDGEVSDRVDASGGYYYFCCVSKYDEELSEANKKSISDNRHKEAFDKVYDEYESRVDRRLIEERWATVDIKDAGAYSAEDFYPVYDRYF
ncbi:MAG: peptidyl-prolyl cis-trans isomerase [Lachnospiraceae bacterium]|nr:peptidyl-prolyl cis-trans isomerase [Lachnospiraceae bacterium]